MAGRGASDNIVELLFFNDYFARKHPAEAAKAPMFTLNTGGGLWLRKRSQGAELGGSVR